MEILSLYNIGMGVSILTLLIATFYGFISRNDLKNFESILSIYEEEDLEFDDNDPQCCQCEELSMQLILARHNQEVARIRRDLVYKILLIALVAGAAIVVKYFQPVLECITNARV